MLRKYTVYLPWIVGFTILFILSVWDGPWPPAPITPTPITPTPTRVNTIRDGTFTATPNTPPPISTTTTPSTDVPVVPTTITPGPISPTPTPTATVPAVPTTVTPTPISTTTTPTATVSVLPTTVTPDPKPTTPSPTPDPIDEQAAELAVTVAPQFEKSFGVKFSPTRAQGQSAAPAGGSANDLVGVVVPVASEDQTYRDKNGRPLEVLGILSIEPPLYVEIEVVVENAPIQYSRLQTGTYMVACTAATIEATNQIQDCIAVSKQGVEFALRPDKKVGGVWDTTYRAPTADFISGSVHACFTIKRRRICVRAF